MGRFAWTVSAVTAIYIAWCDPASLSSRAETAAEAVAQQLFGPDYPPHAASRIVLLETNVDGYRQKERRLNRPLSFGELTSFVDLAAHAGARAIFIDHQFRNEPNDEEAADVKVLAKTIARTNAKAKKAIVFSGPVAPIPALAPLAAVIVQTNVDRDLSHPADYNLQAPDTPQHGRETWPLSAAAALYLNMCQGHDESDSCDPALTDILVKAQTGAARPDPIALRFGTGAGVADFAGRDVRCRHQDFGARLRELLATARNMEPCNHHLVISLHELGMWPMPAVRKAMAGRIVMIGAGPDLGDDHLVPAVGNLPGVAIHAMALDNLLNWGRRYPHWPPNLIPGSEIGLDEILQLSVVLIVPIALTAFARWLTERYPKRKRGNAWIVLTAVLTVMIALGSFDAAAWYWLAWPAGSIFLTLTLAGIVISTMSGDELSRAMSDLNTPRTVLVLGGLMALAAMVAGLFWTAAALIVLLTIASHRPIGRFFRKIAKRTGRFARRALRSLHKRRRSRRRTHPPKPGGSATPASLEESLTCA